METLKIKNNNKNNIVAPIVEAATIETTETPQEAAQEALEDAVIKEMEGVETPAETAETPAQATKVYKGRDYNRPPFKSEMFYDLTTVNFPLQWTNPTNDEVITYENKFGDMKKGDIIAFELNPNNVNTLGVGKVLGFKIQTNGFWIRYEAFNKKPYWKNLNLFLAIATEEQVEQFNQARTEFFKAQEEAKNAKTEEPATAE